MTEGVWRVRANNGTLSRDFSLARIGAEPCCNVIAPCVISLARARESG
jgi:hypothetical protein